MSWGRTGHATAHVFLSSWRCGYGQAAPDSWAMGVPVLWHGCVLADAAKLLQVRCTSPGREWWPEASEGDALPWTARQPGVAHQSYEKGIEVLQWRHGSVSSESGAHWARASV